MPTVEDTAPSADTFQTTFDELSDLARRRLGKVPAELMAAQVIAMTEGADFPVRRAAMEAVVRRYRFGRRDELTVVERPTGGRSLGRYATAGRSDGAGKRGRKRAETRPYRTLLASVVPLRGSCDCADYVKSSLGLCKHLLTVLDDVCGHLRRLTNAAREQAEPAHDRGTRIWWLPALPLFGPLDRLTGLRLHWAPARGEKPGPGWVDTTISKPGPRRSSRDHSHALLGPIGETSEGARAMALVPPIGAGNRGAPGVDRERDANPASPTGGGTARARAFAPDRAVLADPARRLEFLRGLSGRHAPKAEPAAAALIAVEIARCQRARDARQRSERALDELAALKRRLYPYQRDGVRRFLETGRLLLADDMGLGKTTQAVAACHALHRSGAVRRGLLIVPASLKSQWLREWQETTDTPAAIVDGSPEERAHQYRHLKSGFLILNYEQLLKDLPHVRAVRADMVVLDEAQRIKNWATKSAAYVKALDPTYRLVLTGTPMENRLEELASVLDWVDDVALAPKWRLDPWHSISEGDGGRGTMGARNLVTLRERLAPCTLRRLRSEVLRQLPARSDTRVPVPMTEQQRSEHDDLIQPIAALVGRARRRPLTQAEFLKLMSLLTTQRIISNGIAQLRFDDVWPTYSRARADETLLEGLFAPKLGEVRRLIEELALRQERKVVVFSQWRRMLRLAEWSVRGFLDTAGVRSVFFTGAESQRLRTQAVVDFHDEPNVRVMFLSDAGGVGLNLQRAASACINLELPWNPAVLEQRIGRIYRMGQRRPINVYNLVTDYGIEARIAELIASKRALFSGLFDGMSDEIRFEGRSSFLHDVEKIVAPSPTANGGGGADTQAALSEIVDDRTDEGTDTDTLDVNTGAAGQAAQDATPPSIAATPLGVAHTNGADEGASLSASPDFGVRTLLASVQVRRTEGGGVTIEAPPEAAASLVALFEGMARLMGAVANPP
ncbi:MAG: DEAD/DEAH box helicase [Myxococcales bacterium]